MLTTKNPALPTIAFFATAVYPNGCHEELKPFCTGTKAFDMAFSDWVVPRAAISPLFQHVFGAANDAPTFKEIRGEKDGPNVGTLKSISKDAVLFHRNKDGSLIDLLRASIPEPEDPVIDPPEIPEEVPAPKNKGGRKATATA